MENLDKRFDVLCIGEMLADIVVTDSPEIIYDGDQQIVEEITVKPGGDSFNNAIDLARLGNRVAYIGRVSTDPIGELLIRTGREAGVCMEHIVRTDTPQTKMNLLVKRGGERAFLYFPGSSREFTVEDIDFSLLDQCKIVTVGGAFHLPCFDGRGTKELFRRAKQRNVVTAMDVTKDYSGRWNMLLEECYPYLDFFLPSIEQAEKMAGTSNEKEIAAFFLGRGIRNILIKLGKRGCYFQNRELSFYCGSYSVPVVETTGAGDAFVSGFLSGVLKGLSPEACVRVGTACSANVVQHVGATTGMKSLKKILKFMEQNQALEVTYQ